MTQPILPVESHLVSEQEFLARHADARIICRRRRALAKASPGAILVRCCECREQVWISPSSRRLLAKAKPLCVECSLEVDAPISGFFETPQMRAELEQRRRREAREIGVDPRTLAYGMEPEVAIAWDALRRMP